MDKHKNDIPHPKVRFAPPAGTGDSDRGEQIRDHILELLAPCTTRQQQDALHTVAGELDRLVAAVASTEEKNRVIFQESPDAMCLTRRGRIVEVNPAWLKMHGYSSCHAVIGTDILSHIHQADRHILQARRQSFPQLATAVSEVRDLCRDGSIIEVEVYSQPIKINGRQYLLARLRDITSRNRRESDRVRLEARLKETQKLAAMSNLTGSVAHDLNNLLGGMISYPDLILFQLPEDSKLRPPLEEIIKSGEQATAIVQDLMTLTSRKGVARKRIDLNTIVNGCLNSPEYRKLKKTHPGMEVLFQPGGDPGLINGEIVALSKSVMALIAHGAEAKAEGGRVIITTAQADHDAPLGARGQMGTGGFTRLTVEDEGPPIAPEDRERMFEPFYTKKTMGRSGTGLGLAVVRNTVETHCGVIEVKSLKGQGNSFTLYLPLAPEETGEAS